MQSTSTDVAISLRNVSKRFAGSSTEAVTDLSFDVPTGAIVALVGPSGCGKTTTLKMINRLVEPTSGTIEVLGVDQRSVAAHELRRNIGYVIQHVGLFPHRTIERNIGVVPELLGWEKRRIAKRAAELAELGDDYDVEVLETEIGISEALGLRLRAAVTRAAAQLLPAASLPRLPEALAPLVKYSQRLARLKDPRRLYNYCIACPVD